MDKKLGMANGKIGRQDIVLEIKKRKGMLKQRVEVSSMLLVLQKVRDIETSYSIGYE